MSPPRPANSAALRRLGRDWETLAQEDPLWAILTDPGTRGNRWDPDAFFESGRREVRLLVERLRQRDHLPPEDQLRDTGAALDFGCGVGRLTQGLCEHFRGVVGVDISPTMIDLARQHNRHGDRCTYLVNDAPHLDALGDARFDLAYSFIVLQHMPWLVAAGYLRGMAERLTPGGLLVFQLPARQTDAAEHNALRRMARRWIPASLRRWRHARRGDALAARMQMHVTPRETVEALLTELGLTPLDAQPSHAAGPGYEGWLYVARRG